MRNFHVCERGENAGWLCGLPFEYRNKESSRRQYHAVLLGLPEKSVLNYAECGISILQFEYSRSGYVKNEKNSNGNAGQGGEQWEPTAHCV